MLDAAGLSDALSREGCLSLYADDGAFQADREHIAALERFGFEHEVLGGNAIRDLEPAIATTTRRGDGRRIGASDMVLAAGAYPARLSKSLGEPISTASAATSSVGRLLHRQKRPASRACAFRPCGAVWRNVSLNVSLGS